MEKFAFVSRHAPTPDQIRVAAEMNIELVGVGDVDAFGVSEKDGIAGFLPRLLDTQDIEGVICVHALIALRAYKAGFPVGVFQNISRPGPDGKPVFSCGRLEVVHHHGAQV
jgi:hypothetical protein